MFKLPDIPKPKSYQKGNNISYRVREFDPNAHEMQTAPGVTHDRYNCPYCLEKRGEEDDEAKFYWDRTKLIGWCFRCETVGIIKSDAPIDEVRLEVALSAFLNTLVTKSSSDIILSKLPYDKMFDPLDDEGKEYLLSRVPLYSELFDKLNFRVTPKVGLTVPIIIDDMIVSYSLRFYHPSTKMKYFIPTGSKFLYSPNNIINSRNRLIEITLVEGYFDAIGALLDGHVNPIALFGKTITPLQVALLRKVMPSKINIYLDEAALSWKLYHKLKNDFPTCGEINIVPTNFDPEEKLVFRINRADNDEKIQSLFNDVSNALNILEVNKM